MGLAVDPDGELTFEDVDPLVLVVVDVERRAASAWGRLLGDHGAVAGRLDRRPARRKTRGARRRRAAVRLGVRVVICAACSARRRATTPSRAGIFLVRGGK